MSVVIFGIVPLEEEHLYGHGVLVPVPVSYCKMHWSRSVNAFRSDIRQIC